MARLARFKQLIFGSTAGAGEIAEFGSKAAGSPNTYSGSTATPTLIQALAEYLDGWSAAVLGSYSPAVEDMNALFFLLSYQLTYLFEEGIAEYDATTTYYTGSLVQSAGVSYVSLVDSNLGNALTDSTKWFTPVQNGALTPNALPTSMTLPANETMSWPNLQIGNGQTVTVPNSAYLLGFTDITVSGTGVLVATGTGIVRVI